MSVIENSYEFVLVLSSKLGEEKTEEITKKFKDLIETSAKLTNVNKWGKRKLAYLINKEAEGEYILFEFTSGSAFPEELDRISKITDGVLRSMIIKKDVKGDAK